MLLSWPSAVEMPIAIAPTVIDPMTSRIALVLSIGADSRASAGGASTCVRVSVATGEDAVDTGAESPRGACGELASASGAKHKPHHRASAGDKPPQAAQARTFSYSVEVRNPLITAARGVPY